MIHNGDLNHQELRDDVLVPIRFEQNQIRRLLFII
jgi:hypothetical protein